MAGCSLAACTIAYAMMWVKLTFSLRSALLSAALSPLRRASRTPTPSVRSEVAVGIDSDASM